MPMNSTAKLGLGSALLVGALVTGCAGGGVDGAPPAPDGEAQADKAYIQAEITLKNLIPEEGGQASYRAVDQGVPTSGDFELWFSPIDNPGEVVHTERVQNAPFGQAALRIPAELQGRYYISAWIYGDDGSVYTTADLVRGPDGELLYPDAPRPQIDLRLGSVSDLVFVFFEQLRFDDGEVAFNSRLTVDLQLTPEQRALVSELYEPGAQGILSGCLAYGATLGQELRWDEASGVLRWEQLGDAFLLVGKECTYEVKVTDDGATRLRGAVDFIAPPGDGSVHELSMDLRVVDAFIDAAFDIRGVAAETRFTLDEDLAAYLDESEWQHGLRYELEADNGHGHVLVATLSREGDSLSGSLAPIDEVYPNNVVTLRILDGDSVVLQGRSSVDFFASSEMSFSLDYQLDIAIGAKNLTNVHFNAWLGDDPAVTRGIHVVAHLVSPEGLAFYSECDTGSLAAYSCRLEIPTYSAGTVEYSYPGYVSVSERLDVSQLESINLPYVSMVSDGTSTSRGVSEEVVHPMSGD